MLTFDDPALGTGNQNAGMSMDVKSRRENRQWRKQGLLKGVNRRLKTFQDSRIMVGIENREKMC